MTEEAVAAPGPSLKELYLPTENTPLPVEVAFRLLKSTEIF